MRRLRTTAAATLLIASVALVGACGGSEPGSEGTTVPTGSASVSEAPTTEPVSTDSTTPDAANDETTPAEPPEEPAVEVLGTFAPLTECPDLGELGFTSEHFEDMSCGYLRGDLLIGLEGADEPLSRFRDWSEADAAADGEIVLADHPELGAEAFSYTAVEGSSPQTVAMYGCVFYLPTTEEGTFTVWGVPAGYANVTSDDLCRGAREVVDALLIRAG